MFSNPPTTIFFANDRKNEKSMGIISIRCLIDRKFRSFFSIELEFSNIFNACELTRKVDNHVGEN